MRNWFSSGKNNRKHKKYGSKLLTFGLPALKSKTGITTCPGAGTCVRGCYAQQGHYVMPHVKQTQERRLALTLKPNFREIISQELTRRHPKYVRLHDSGDFYTPCYLGEWLWIIDQHPEILFFAYTKMVLYFLSSLGGGLPENFKVAFSEGGRWDRLIDRKRHKFARVFDSKKKLLKAGFVNASKDDLPAILGRNNKIGLVYHGWKSRKFTTGGES